MNNTPYGWMYTGFGQAWFQVDIKPRQESSPILDIDPRTDTRALTKEQIDRIMRSNTKL